jgi:hypothetical protein
MISIPSLAINTPVIAVDFDGNEKPAHVVANIVPGRERVAFDEEAKDVAEVTYSTEGGSGTFRFQGAESEADAPKKKPFKPGAQAADAT